MAARLGVEPSPFASEAAVLETARAAAHLRAAKAETIQPYTSKTKNAIKYIK